MVCALCGKNAELQQSHIIPKLVYSRIKSHKNSRFRSLDNITKIMQDGEKRPMLCHDCEELFSSYEVKFTKLFLDDYLETNKFKKITSGVVENYILTVAWRILWDELYRLHSFTGEFSRLIFEEFCADLGKYLLTIGKACEEKPPKRFRNYVYPLCDLISDEAINKISTGCLFGYVMYFKDSNSFSVIVYYAGLVFVTDYLYDRTRYTILNTKPILFRKRYRKNEIIAELRYMFGQIALQYNQKMTPELSNKIKKYYQRH